MKAAIYDASGDKVAETSAVTVYPNGQSQAIEFDFSSPPTLNANTQYVLVVWSPAGTGTNPGTAELRYSATTGGDGRSASATYGNWPTHVDFTTDSNQYVIQCNYHYYPEFRAKAAIYSADGSSLIANTEERTLSNIDGWVTFNFASSPALTATNYVLVVYASSNTVDTYYDTGSIHYFRGTATYPAWPTAVTDQGSRTYSIYCTYTVP
jgi:hypothetical protein